ncbi:sulfotransferase 1C4 [Trichonephila clavipes]|uniref:Sulfotransferase 1C4 n=1 Tax=Trichonephila clavipes TaxID=2585209 RepID=A0A8X6V594_TRICX|nr:sulfotransferase 1C4 [Trichonephila clavipes]
MMEVIEAMPFLEQDGPSQNSCPMALKYHLPFRLTPFSEDSLYLYIARNPKDTCVSYYHFLKVRYWDILETEHTHSCYIQALITKTCHLTLVALFSHLPGVTLQKRSPLLAIPVSHCFEMGHMPFGGIYLGT